MKFDKLKFIAAFFVLFTPILFSGCTNSNQNLNVNKCDLPSKMGYIDLYIEKVPSIIIVDDSKSSVDVPFTLNLESIITMDQETFVDVIIKPNLGEIKRYSINLQSADYFKENNEIVPYTKQLDDTYVFDPEKLKYFEDITFFADIDIKLSNKYNVILCLSKEKESSLCKTSVYNICYNSQPLYISNVSIIYKGGSLFEAIVSFSSYRDCVDKISVKDVYIVLPDGSKYSDVTCNINLGESFDTDNPAVCYIDFKKLGFSESDIEYGKTVMLVFDLNYNCYIRDMALSFSKIEHIEQ